MSLTLDSSLFYTLLLLITEVRHHLCSKGTVNKVILQDWEFVGGSKNNEDEAEGKKSQPKATYQEHYCTDDDELPL